MNRAKPQKSSRTRDDIAAEGDRLRATGRALRLCWLPGPQERAVPGEMPGKREDGKLWFDGDPKGKPQSAPAAEPRKESWKSLPNLSDGPRDVRKGDR